MNRLEKLKNRLADEYILKQDFDEDCLTERTNPGTPVGECTYHTLCGCFIHETYKEGFDAASAEYEKIIAELEGALDSIIEIDLITHKMHPEYEGQFSEYADRAKEALQKLKEFKNTKE